MIGGGITLLGVILTIKAENKKGKRDYLEKIKPFFVVESTNELNIEKTNIKQIWVNDDSLKDFGGDQIIYHWNYLLISNVGESVCMISYIKINNEKYTSFDNIPIKPGDFCEIKGFPLSAFIKRCIDDITIGFLDRNFNLYEYIVRYEVKEYTGDVGALSKHCHKLIEFSLIDCSNNLAKKVEKHNNKIKEN